MKTTVRLALLVALAAISIAPSGCNQGVGMSVPASGARWGGPGPDVFVTGGPR